MSDKYYKKEAIDFFRSLIEYKLSIGKNTRPINFSGHIGRHMTPKVKKWFLDKYPNNTDYIKFFLENKDVFTYHPLTGDVMLNSPETQFVMPSHLSKIEKLIKSSDSPVQTSKLIFELEFFLKIFKQFVQSLKFYKITAIEVEKLVQLFREEKYSLIIKQISSMVSNDTDLDEIIVEYLRRYYPTIFTSNKTKTSISVTKIVVDLIDDISEQIDDIVYELFEQLIVKYLRSNGGKDVIELSETISKRHGFIYEYIFGRKPDAEEYTFLDFIDSHKKVFVLKREIDVQSNVKRIVNVIIDPKPERMKNELTNSVNNGSSDVVMTQSIAHKSVDLDNDDIYYEDKYECGLISHIKTGDEPEMVQTNDLISCCVCQDIKPEEFLFSQFKQWVLKHKVCIIRKMCSSLVNECHRRLSVDDWAQTVSTGSIRARQGISSYFHY